MQTNSCIVNKTSKTKMQTNINKMLIQTEIKKNQKKKQTTKIAHS